MNNVKNKMLASLFIITMVLGAIPIITAHSAPDVFWIEPEAGLSFDTGTASVGDKFNITVWAQTTQPCYTWQVQVTFDPTQIKADRCDYTGVGKSLFFTGHGTIPVVAVIDNTTGTVATGESLVGADSVPAGTGSLFWVEFEIFAAPPPGGSLTSTIGIDNAQTFLLSPSLDQISLNKDDTTYTYTWLAPPKPILAVSPSLIVKPKEFVWVGTTFTVDVVIPSMDAAWFLKNVTTHLGYSSTLLEVKNVAFDAVWTTNTFTNNTGDLILFAETGTPPSGNVKIATITFLILIQGTVPPDPAGTHTDSPLNLNNYALYSSYNFQINTNPEVDGLVQVYSFQSVPPAHLEVSSVTMGPAPVVGQEFNVTVSIVGASNIYNLIGVQFRLTYDPTFIEPVATYEGPFMPFWASQQPGSLGTFYVSYFETLPAPHVLVGNMIFPNGTGQWNAPMPDGDGIIAYITFRVLYQGTGLFKNITALHLYDVIALGLDNLEDQNLVYLTFDPSVDGTYTIMSQWPGRVIDVYGFAVNSGLIEPDWQQILQFVPPYGGQGPNMPMDLVEEQSWVWLHANVTYNGWPVQHKMVGFEIRDNNGNLYGNLFAFTDDNGVATVGFRMPWPCQNPESLIGTWEIIASVQLADVFIFDHMPFHYDFLVHIWKVTTDKYAYQHGEVVYVEVEFGSHAQQYYNVLIKVHIMDELGVIFGHFEVETEIGGAIFCQYNNYTVRGAIPIPKWAYAGFAHVYANAFNCEPSQGGAPIGPEYAPPVEILIYPGYIDP